MERKKGEEERSKMSTLGESKEVSFFTSPMHLETHMNVISYNFSYSSLK
jgi:hypothetical protein